MIEGRSSDLERARRAEEVVASPASGEAEEDFASMLEESFRSMGQQADSGTMVRGHVVKVTADVAFVDLGGKSEGVIDLNELKDADGKINVAIGDLVEATVVGSSGDDEGTLRLSKSMQKGVRSKEMLYEAYRGRLAVEGRVVSRNKGGFEVQVSGMRCFVPLSQIDRNRFTDPDVYLNQTYQFRIMEIREGGRNIVLSRSQLMKEEAEAKARVLRESLKEGDVVTGTVRNIRDIGVFVDLGGMDGFVHVSELTWGRVKHPSEVVKEGETVTVQVIKFDRDKNKVSLSMKTLASSPWDEIGTRWCETGIYSGKVARLMEFGAFVELAPGLEGLLHISNMVWDRRIKNAAEVVKEGDIVTVQILSIDPEKKRVALGMKQLGSDPWEGAFDRYTAGKLVEGTVEKIMPFGLFICLEPGVTGLIPNSEMATARGSDHSRDFKEGQVVQVKVLDIDLAQRKITLSRKALQEDGQKADLEAYIATKAQEAPKQERPSGSLGTLGDLLAAARARKK